MQKILSFYKNIALSNTDILRLVDGKANVVLYPELHKVKKIDDILNPYGACFLLYEAKPRFGHWCALLKTVDDDGTPLIEFFDPYGGFVDTQRKFIPEMFRKMSKQDVPYLSYLLLKSKYELSYNPYQLQKKSNSVRDCGRWAALRIFFRDMPLEQFKHLFYGRDSDDLATFFTMDPSQIKN